MNTKFDIDYFIQKFEALKDSEVGRAKVSNHCALWHCGVRRNNMSDQTEEAEALSGILNKVLRICSKHWSAPVWQINDGKPRSEPRINILSALYKIKGEQPKAPEVKERIVYVAVPVSITKQAKELILS